ncbi:hypothetical protein U3516DRAFT_475839, partial [Neocallimastix sp. 'constans']
MDEADLLADRKMIISGGSITCLGTSLFLNNCFHMNYNLDIFVKDFKDVYLSDPIMNHYCSNASQTKSITTINGNATMTSKMELENIPNKYIINYLLLIKCSNKFSSIFQDLNKIMKDKSNTVNNFSLTAPTLEELFVKLE